MCRYALAFILSATALLSSADGESAVKPNDWRARLMQPGHEFAQMPFWFWNDELSDAETRRQLAAFREKGIYGVIIHARMGLPKSIPYMGKVWLERVRFAVEEAARTGMYVCLYDEGMYPSGSAHGEVVKSNADFAAQGLACHAKDVTGPTEVRVAAPRKGKFVAAVVARQTEKKDVLDLDGAVVVTEPGRAAKLGEGKWRVMTFVMEPTGGHIRGVHYGEEDGEPGAPAAADLLSFEAMQAFIRFCHEPYHETLKGHFGKTVFAIFTDEPSLSGRGGRSGLRPWTAGLAADFKKRRGYALAPLLPALFFDVGERTRKVRDDFDLTVAERLDETYYQQLSRWCAGHGIALTGHPAHSDEIRPLRLFQIPGQDMVWRWVLPGKNAIDGENSTVGKCSSSVARHDGRRRNANEIYGAYGWHLTMDEMKWLADWLIVRGVNLLYPHAVYYTIRDKRAYERPPDLGIHNSWWPRYRVFADYTARLCGLMADCEQVCEVAVLSVNNTLPWRAAKWLFQHQVDFNYLEDWRLVEQAKIEGGRIRIGAMAYTTLIVDQDRPLTGETAKGVQAFKDAGGVVHTCQGEPSAKLVAGLGRDVVVEPPSVDVRAAHVVKDKMHFYLFVNEGEGPIDATVTVRCFGTAQWYDAWSDKFTGAPVEPRGKDRLATPLRLGRRESVILCVDPARPPLMASACYAPRGEPTVTEIGGAWKVTDGEGKQVLDKLGDWRDVPELKQFAGTLTYATTFEAKRQAGRKVELDLGKVGDWAVVRLNSKDLGPRFWAPYVVDVSEAIRDGKNELEVEVTNSFSNKYVPKDARAAGLMGPVRLRCY